MNYPPKKEIHQKKTRKTKPILLTILAIIIILFGVFIGYVADYYDADETAYALLENTEEVQFLTDDPIHFSPTAASDIGIIFYPGGKVDEVAYTSLMQPLAEEGYNTFIPEMPFHLAVFDVDAADAIINNNPDIKHWYVGGHSLGAAMAASYAADNLDKIDGLILLAGYSTTDLSQSNLPVLALYGSEDKVIDTEKVAEYRPNLPAETREEVIAVGNHAQFGRYGEQVGDAQAEISIEEQLSYTITVIHEFISQQRQQGKN